VRACVHVRDGEVGGWGCLSGLYPAADLVENIKSRHEMYLRNVLLMAVWLGHFVLLQYDSASLSDQSTLFQRSVLPSSGRV
jgi:hypothetical protein